MATTALAHNAVLARKVTIMGARDGDTGIFHAALKVERTKHIFNCALVCAKDRFVDAYVDWPVSTLGRQPGPPATERIELKYGYDCKPLGIPDNASTLFSKEARLVGEALGMLRRNDWLKAEVEEAEKRALSAGEAHGPIRSQKPLG